MSNIGKQRLYHVQDGDHEALVWAISQQQAQRQIIRDRVKVSIAQPADIVRLAGGGVVPQTAGEDSETDGSES